MSPQGDPSSTREGSVPHGASIDHESARLETPEMAATRYPQNELGNPREQAVRFSSKLQEIEPEHSLHLAETPTPENLRSESINSDAQAELQNLSISLQKSHLQQGRLTNFAFEPVSLPASRVPSNDSSYRQSSDTASQKRAPSVTSMHTPPLTPAGSAGKDGQKLPLETPPLQMTPQNSGLQIDVPATSEQRRSLSSTSIAGRQRPSSSGQISSRSANMSSSTGISGEASPRSNSIFFTGASESVPASREESPLETPASSSGTVTPPTQYSRPFTPGGDKDDPYARSKRPPQPRNLESIDARFIFGGKDSRRHSSFVSQGAPGQLPRSSSGLEGKNQEKPQEKNQSNLSLHKKDHDQNTAAVAVGSKHGSMADLKRFLRFGHSNKRTRSPASSRASNKSGSVTPPAQQSSANVPFADDHGLQSKYGKFGKVLGSGAGGSVRLMKRSSDGVTFAVKQFRDRHNYETEREYAKKVTAEFCIGSTLHHGNIIETLDIVQERGHWYEVMEYAPYDLFATVMTGKMSREEIACSFLQIFAGVTYLHSMGLAHRDLKLDNVVVNEHGIMKIIDFGSAIVYRYPFENDIVLATGVVGSDPYLAPEVYDNTRYDPQPTDIWSLAIIFACMSLRRFPWKVPRLTDNSYKLFVSTPTPVTQPTEGNSRRSFEQRPHSVVDGPTSPVTDKQGTDDASTRSSQRHHHNRERNGPSDGSGISTDGTSSKPEVVKGPWRLLRLLPRESRNIIGRMLEVDPKKRATIEDMLEDPWVSNAAVCQQVDHGRIVKATGHTHTLEPGSSDSAAPTRKSGHA